MPPGNGFDLAGCLGRQEAAVVRPMAVYFPLGLTALYFLHSKIVILNSELK